MVDPVETFVVRVWLPDRPGALGQVASRIGAVRGDVVGIDILERGGGRAVDELVVSMPDGSLVDLLLAEIGQVDGVAVEDIRRVASERPDPGLLALEVAAHLAESAVEDRLAVLGHELTELLDGDWVAAIDLATELAVHRSGDVPDVAWLAAFLDGSSHLSDADQVQGAPGDLAWGRLGASQVVVAIGRGARPFHTRERQQVSLLCRVAGALLPDPASI